jgi:hypothetical protein
VATAPRALSGADAQRALDSITDTFNSDRAAADAQAQTAAALRAIPALQALLPRLPSALDSVWAEVHLGEAFGVVNDAPRACEALSRASRLPRTTNQRQIIERYDGLLACGR